MTAPFASDLPRSYDAALQHVDESYMPLISFQHALTGLNTFGIDASAERFIEFSRLDDLQTLIAEGSLAGPRLILSGGSNLLFLGDFAGVVIHSRLAGVRSEIVDEQHVLVTAAGGESWHGLVEHCLSLGYSGLENLALIPGTVGAAPVQNIGAYGVELAERLVALDAVDLDTGAARHFAPAECGFGYRESIFKHGLKDKALITSVTLRLDRLPRTNTHYGAIQAELAAAGFHAPSPRDVFDAVCRIRRSKLPDPAQLGNAGSFFKNPVVDESHYRALLAAAPGLVAYPQRDGGFKLAAGWLIERCGFRGVRRGAVGVHERQSLVLVNYGGGTGAQVLALAEEIVAAVHERFGVVLTPEVRFVGGTGFAAGGGR